MGHAGAEMVRTLPTPGRIPCVSVPSERTKGCSLRSPPIARGRRRRCTARGRLLSLPRMVLLAGVNALERAAQKSSAPLHRLRRRAHQALAQALDKACRCQPQRHTFSISTHRLTSYKPVMSSCPLLTSATSLIGSSEMRYACQ